ncbi:MAG: hypothetical protein HEQ40_13530 [Lacibacter sp.]|jgi:hypothetical protein
MNEEEKKESPPSTDDSPQQNAQLNPPSTDETIAPAEINSEAEPQPETSNQKPETETDMEVHHHTHHEHGKRNWKSYFWEFLMLFLAVFCGFLAEYQLEHKIERDRAKELAKNLYDELKADSVLAQTTLGFRLNKNEACLNMAVYLRNSDSSLERPSSTFYRNFSYAFTNTAGFGFEPKNAVLSQLINSGALRYFKSNELQTKLSEMQMFVNRMKDRNYREFTLLDFTIRPYQIKHFDNRWNAEILKDVKDSISKIWTTDYARYKQPRILHLSEFDREEMENVALQIFMMSNGTMVAYIKPYIKLNHELLATLRKEYHLE